MYWSWFTIFSLVYKGLLNTIFYHAKCTHSVLVLIIMLMILLFNQYNLFLMVNTLLCYWRLEPATSLCMLRKHCPEILKFQINRNSSSVLIGIIGAKLTTTTTTTSLQRANDFLRNVSDSFCLPINNVEWNIWVMYMKIFIWHWYLWIQLIVRKKCTLRFFHHTIGIYHWST